MRITLSVIMFAYNEGDNIVPIVTETIRHLEQRPSDWLGDYQLVLVDDGSTDDTAAKIDTLAAANARILPLSHGTNRGIGHAVKTGFSAARMDYVTILPADGQVTVSEIDKLVPGVLDGADFVVGHYTQRKAVDGLGRFILSRGLRAWMLVLLGVRQPMDGVYLFRRSLLKQIRLTSDTFFVNLELPIRAERQRLDVRHVPVEVHPRRSGHSKVLGLQKVTAVGTEVVRLRLQFWKEHWSK